MKHKNSVSNIPKILNREEVVAFLYECQSIYVVYCQKLFKNNISRTFQSSLHEAFDPVVIYFIRQQTLRHQSKSAMSQTRALENTTD